MNLLSFQSILVLCLSFCNMASVAAQNNCSGLCDNVAYPNRLITTSGSTTATCAEANTYLKTISGTDPTCTTAPSVAGTFCGCTSAPPSCTQCYGNDAIPNYSKTLDYFGTPLTCGELAYATSNTPVNFATGQVNQTLCTIYQEATNLFCGCPKAPPNLCSVCSSTQTFLSLRLIVELFIVTNNDTTLTNFKLTCGMAQLYLHLSTNDCAAILSYSKSMGIQSSCCTSGSVQSSSPRILLTAGAVLLSASAFLFM
jgi:hypothetical protein